MKRVTRVRQLIDENFNGRQADFAKAIKKAPTQVSHWLTGERNIGDGVASQIEAAFDLPRGWLDGNGTAEVIEVKYENKEKPNKGFIRFGVLEVEAAAGSGSYNNEHTEIVRMIDVSEKWAQQHLGGNLSRIKIITATGDSMADTIQPGDLLFVDNTIQDYKGEGIYILATAEGLKVKRLELLLNGRMKVISDNKQHYDPQIINKEDFEHIKICGQVLANWTLNKL